MVFTEPLSDEMPLLVARDFAMTVGRTLAVRADDAAPPVAGANGRFSASDDEH